MTNTTRRQVVRGMSLGALGLLAAACAPAAPSASAPAAATTSPPPAPAGTAATSSSASPSAAVGTGASASPSAVGAVPSGQPSAVPAAPVAAASPSPNAGNAGPALNTGRMVTVQHGEPAPPSIAGAGRVIASEMGWFAQEGIDLQLVPFQTTNDVVAPLASGVIDVGLFGVSAGIFNAVARGIAARFVADGGSNQPGFDYHGLMVRKALVDSGQVKSPADFKGLRFTLPLTGTPTDYVISKALALGGLTLNDIEQVGFLSLPDTIVAMTGGRVDVGWMYEPFVSLAVQSGVAVRFLTGQQVWQGPGQGGILGYSGKFSQDTDAATRYMVAYLKGVRLYNDAFGPKKDPAALEQVIPIFVKNIPNVTRESLLANYPTGLDPNGNVFVQSISDQQAFFVKQGWQQQALDLAPIVDRSFAQGAVQVLGPYT